MASMTHALLFLVAQSVVLVPGVCDACVKGCCANGTPRIADVASPILTVAAEPVGCRSGHCCGIATEVDAAVDRCGAEGGAKCLCQVEPRNIGHAAVTSGGPDRRDSRPGSRADGDAVAVAWLPPVDPLHRGSTPLAGPSPGWGTAVHARPVRVLYGVWRN